MLTPFHCFKGQRRVDYDMKRHFNNVPPKSKDLQTLRAKFVDRGLTSSNPMNRKEEVTTSIPFPT
jgi:hypothetical protein